MLISTNFIDVAVEPHPGTLFEMSIKDVTEFRSTAGIGKENCMRQ